MVRKQCHVLTTHVIVIDCGTNMWTAHCIVNINNEMIMICILPVRVKEQPKLGALREVARDNILAN